MKLLLAAMSVLVSTTGMLAFGETAFALTVKQGDVVNKVREVSIEATRVGGQPANILADSKGISVYTFDLDKPGNSVCKGGCLTEWPALHVDANEVIPAPFGKIVGNDGKPQLTLNGLPLYYYVDDKNPGDVFGDYPKWHPVMVTN
jgi:predicted lipoprotein with Yx(FWY)xxD motif